MKWKSVIDGIKSKYRPALNSWNNGKFASNNKSNFDELKKFPIKSVKTLPREKCDALSAQHFREKYEVTSTPCLIHNVPNVMKWPALKEWSWDRLSAKYRECHFSCGRDTDGEDLLVQLDDYLSYMKENDDDSPLYIFDTYFELDEVSAELLSHYQVPPYFPEDLLNMIDPELRPSYRWFLIGPERSGTILHIDPLYTSAWNTLITGRKRWVLFPPSVSKDQVIPEGMHQLEESEAIHYFMTHLPLIRQQISEELIYEVIQEAGDTIFVPSGWWHAVINLEDTVAITQNFCSSHNFPQVWQALDEHSPTLAEEWLIQLEQYHPILAQQAKKIKESGERIPQGNFRLSPYAS